MNTSALYAASAFCLAATPAFAQSPCDNPTNHFGHAQTYHRTALEALSHNTHIAPGSAKSIAQCVLRGRVEVTACLTVARAAEGEAIWLVFDIFGGDEEWATHGASIVGDGGWNGTLGFGLEMTNGSYVKADARGVWASATSVDAAVWTDQPTKGSKTRIDFDAMDGILTYQVYDGASRMPVIPLWSLKQNQTFDCQSIF